MACGNETLRTMLIACVAALLGVGIIMIYSTTARGDGPLVSPVFIKQMLYVAFALAAAILVARIDYHRILEANGKILTAVVVLLVLVLVPGIGHRANGASRWLRLGPVGMQPSEAAKIALIIFMAWFLGDPRRRSTDFKRTIMPVMAVAGLVCLLVLVEPDIGTCILLAAVGALVLFVAGARITQIAAPAILGLPLLAYKLSSGYALLRIQTWLNPWRDPSDAGYHIIQSLVAIGSGGVTGVGLGRSQQKLFFLPESQSDFIFAILAEETGLIGVTLVLCLYAGFVICGMSIAMRAVDLRGKLLAAGITSLVGLQAVINIAVVTQVLPTKGIALPFISAGGSSVVATLVGVGLLYSVAVRSAPKTADELVA